ncbi:hypothetical protein DLAC_02060 [Tieghemostelium lacteum]|uniref:Uncharacterized protein n=1 Tax=Tieghemostelium lacteum TaxID=361077 RepID=A0A152A519_TIELA|nr:hypothetical protein DLAC_02060 [Tieghemostelium lacteum]|eukprot:KYR01336.1 hypothetical protein DLAC_02060 [Tieghemostelium lacteum]
MNELNYLSPYQQNTTFYNNSDTSESSDNDYNSNSSENGEQLEVPKTDNFYYHNISSFKFINNFDKDVQLHQQPHQEIKKNEIIENTKEIENKEFTEDTDIGYHSNVNNNSINSQVVEKEKKQYNRIIRFLLWFSDMNRRYKILNILFTVVICLTVSIELYSSISRHYSSYNNLYSQLSNRQTNIYNNNVHKQQNQISNNQQQQQQQQQQQTYQYNTYFQERVNSLIKEYEQYNIQGDNDKSLQTLLNLLKISPRLCGAMFRVGQIFSLKEQYHNSEEMYLKALDCERWLKLEYIVELSSFYNSFHRYQESISLINRASLFFPNNTKLQTTISQTKNLMQNDNIDGDIGFKFYSCVD